jgi:hypothetical protein
MARMKSLGLVERVEDFIAGDRNGGGTGDAALDLQGSVACPVSGRGSRCRNRAFPTRGPPGSKPSERSISMTTASGMSGAAWVSGDREKVGVWQAGRPLPGSVQSAPPAGHRVPRAAAGRSGLQELEFLKWRFCSRACSIVCTLSASLEFSLGVGLTRLLLELELLRRGGPSR